MSKITVTTVDAGTFQVANGSVSAPTVSTATDPDTGIWFPAADTIAASTGGSERMRIDNAGDVILGRGEASGTVVGATLRGPVATGTNIAGADLTIQAGNGTGTGGSGEILFKVAGTGSTGSTPNTMSTKARVTAGGQLVVGGDNAASQVAAAGLTPALQVVGTGSSVSSYGGWRFSADAGGPSLSLVKSRNSSIGSHTIVNSGDTLGTLQFVGSDGSAYVAAADITCQVDTTPGTNDMPGRLVFRTTADGASSVTEAMRIDNAGRVLIGRTSAIGTEIAAVEQTNGVVLALNRTNSDGTIVSFCQDGISEGVISVAGTTITYGAFSGSHWSQLLDNSKPDILRGTVVETIDAMCEWPGEDNDQLAKFKISDTPASKRVYGVFMTWDNNDDKNNDAYITSLGAYLIRIAAGVTVQGGDLLESNGDGCARVQADDLIRSSTIAKVTSNVVTETYPDGSYLVPCVLYCG